MLNSNPNLTVAIQPNAPRATTVRQGYGPYPISLKPALLVSLVSHRRSGPACALARWPPVGLISDIIDSLL